MSAFAHLHVHSQYSLLNGAIRLKDLIQRTKELEMDAVAMTDTGNMFGAVDFFKRAKKQGVKPIIGTEALVAEYTRTDPEAAAYPIVLLAKDDTGYANLRSAVSRAYLEGFHRGIPRLDMEVLRAHREGVIALSGTTESLIARAVLQDRPERARELIEGYCEIFGRDHFFLEVIPSGTPEQDRVNSAYLELGTSMGVGLVATNNCLYLDRRDARAHEVLMCIGSGRSLDDPNRPRHDVDSYWFKSPELIAQQLGDAYGEAMTNAGRIADACNVEIELGKIYLPQYDVPASHSEQTFLVECANEGLKARYREFDALEKTYDTAEYQDRLDEELGIIISMDFPGYFLIVQDFINWAKEKKIPVGPGRGSGAGSLVAYALRITDIDPIPYGLLFERFLNPERVSMPDFDIDFCMNRRGEVIDYVTEKYGSDNVGQIATFGGLKARGVIKDVGRVLGLSFGETDRLSKMVPEVLGITLDEAVAQEPRLRQLYDDDDRVRDLIDIARNLEGLFKSTGIHAAGVVIGDKPIWEYCPVFRGANDELVTQFAKEEVEEAGLVKFDFLGLKTLTVIDDAVRMVNRDRPEAEHLDMDALTLDDPAVYALISRGDTDGVFQLESGGFRELLKKLKPDKFEDIVAAVALYRPGPLNSGMLDDFIARKHGKQAIAYPHPSLKEILHETYGVIVYQEQVMQIAQVLAGFTLGAADILRRAMGKKKAEVMAAQRLIFADGAKERNIEAGKASEIFDLMEKFAAYGFNKSHSAAYALITYHTGYLKTHHRVEFMAAVLTSDRDNGDKVAKGIRAAKSMGIEVLPPSVNQSGVHFDAVDKKLLFGMGGVKGVGTTSVEAIVEAREAGGLFESLFDFCERVDLKRVNKKTIEALIKSGAFDFCGHPRARLTAAIDPAIERAQNTQRDRASGQSSMFAILASNDDPSDDSFSAEVMAVQEWPEQVVLANEKESLGFYVSGHPLDRFSKLISRYSSTTIDQLNARKNFDTVTIGGIQTSVRIRPFRNGDGRMAIVQFEDLTGSIEVIAMGADLDRYEALLTSDEPLLITGAVRGDRGDSSARISVRIGGGRRRGQPLPEEPEVVSLQELRATKSRAMEIRLASTRMTREAVEALRNVLGTAEFAGTCELIIKLMTPPQAGECEVTLIPKAKVAPSDGLLDALRRALGRDVEIITR